MQSSTNDNIIIPMPYFKLKYTHNKKTTDISEDISNDVISISYSDNGHGKSDSINLSIQNSSSKWMDSWKPDMGDALELTLGYKEDKLAVCGTFEICDVSFSGEPDIITITAEATKYTDPLRAKRAINFNIPEDGEESKIPKTLADIIKVIKDNYKDYEIVGLNTIDNKEINTIQNNKSDLEFLKEQADRYGYFFKMNFNKLVFYKKEKLENENKVNISREDVISYSFSHKTVELFKSVKIIYQDIDKQVFKECKITDQEIKAGKEDREVIYELLNDNNAEEIAKNKIKEQNSGDITGNIEIRGNPKFISGGNIKLNGFFKFDQEKYAITSVTHNYSRGSGYITRINFSNINSEEVTPEVVNRELLANEEG